MKKSGQQEMVGFVLIVIIVIVALMVFLVISLRTTTVKENDDMTNDLISAIMRSTTECVIGSELESMAQLISSCNDGSRCKNLNMMACAYLNDSAKVMMDDLISTETSVISYEFMGYWESSDKETRRNIFAVGTSACNITMGSIIGGGQSIPTGSSDGKLQVRLNLCKETI